jgi:hypothetical protein
LKISPTVTATELFHLENKKNRKQPNEALDDKQHYQESISVPINFKRSKCFKNCKQCTKNKTRKQTQLQCKK